MIPPFDPFFKLPIWDTLLCILAEPKCAGTCFHFSMCGMMETSQVVFGFWVGPGWPVLICGAIIWALEGFKERIADANNKIVL